jgi:hypothetical protein
MTMAERETRLDAASEALRSEAARNKADLTQGTNTVVSDGKDGGQGPRPPFADARKALYEKSARVRDTQTQADVAADPILAAQVRAMEQEAAGGQPPAPSPTPAANGAPSPAPTPSSQEDDTYVSLTYNGRTISVAQSDLTDAGGPEMYLRRRALDDRAADLAKLGQSMADQKKALDTETEQLNRRRADTERLPAAGQGSPAPSPTGTVGQPPEAGAASAEEQLQREAERLTSMLFTGDQTDATKAIAQIIRSAQAGGGRMPSADEVAEIAARKLQASAPRTEARAPTPAPAPDPAWEETRKRINAMCERDFPEINASTEATTAARDELIRLSKLPQNKDRDAVDIARQACRLVKQKMGLDHPYRQEAATLKQGLPPSTSAGGSAPTESGEPAALSNADYVAMLQQRRRFGVRTQ